MLTKPDYLCWSEESSATYVNLPKNYYSKVMECHGPEIDSALDYLLIEAFRYQRSNFEGLPFNSELEAMIGMTFSDVLQQVPERYHSMLGYRIVKERYGEEHPWARNKVTWNVILNKTNRLLLSMTN